MAKPGISIAVLGASGLIGHALTLGLQRMDYHVVPFARRFTTAQSAAHVVPGEELGLREIASKAGAEQLGMHHIVVNCVGVLQDAPGSSTEDAHLRFVTRLLGAIPRDTLLIHLSIPQVGADATDFAQSKRAAEAAIAASGRPYLILRPGFVLADAALGGSALMRALAVLPLALPPPVATTPFAVTDIADIVATVAHVADRWRSGDRAFAATWDVLSDESTTVGTVLQALRRHLGGPTVELRLPWWLLALGARAGDLASLLGWSPPVRSTALAEMRRGVAGDPEPWRKATGIAPRPLARILAERPATVQERWFARLFPLKPVILGGLAVFWVASGLIALFASFDAAADILVRHGFSPGWAAAGTIASSLVDIAVGVGIAVRRTSRAALALGLAVSAFYMLAAAVLAPELWGEPLGALVKTVPAVVLMLVALATLDNR